jgi:hypothetical protein
MDSRSTYLKTASRYLFTHSPTTSAHLMSEHINLLTNAPSNSKFPSALAKPSNTTPTCLSCGTILVPGLTSRKSISSIRPKASNAKDVPQNPSRNHKPKRLSSTRHKSILLEECMACHRVTRHELTPTRTQARHNVQPRHSLRKPSQGNPTEIDSSHKAKPEAETPTLKVDPGDNAGSPNPKLAIRFQPETQNHEKEPSQQVQQNKSRKRKTGGLKALLAKARLEEEKARNDSKTELDFMDFMKAP